MIRSRSGTTALLSWTALLLMCACDQLGNPPLRHGHTDATVWRADGIEVVTSSQTFPSERAGDLLRSLPPRLLQQTEPFPPVGATLTLVMVEVASRHRALPYTLRFLTALALPSGRILQRSWQASGRESTFYTVLRVPQSPSSVVTRLR